VAVAGLFLALSEAYVVGYVGSQWKDVISMVLLVAVLLWRALDGSLRAQWRVRKGRRSAAAVAVQGT
jgi:branched-subunit amino acid ABC-type transport system permease component